MSKKYDYYIEPCQLCISRSGSTYENCGWCHEADTHYKKGDGRYAGDWVIIPYGGYGYPFHELPHETRQYFQGDAYIELSDGKLPDDVTAADVEMAISRNKAVKDVMELYDSPDKKSTTNEVNNAINKLIELENPFMARNHSANDNDFSKVDFFDKFLSLYNKIKGESEELNLKSDDINLPKGRFDNYSMGMFFSGISLDDAKEIKQDINNLENRNLSGDFLTSEMIEENPSMKNLLILMELVSHEYFHLFQTLTLRAPNQLINVSREIAELNILTFFTCTVSENLKFDIDSKTMSSLVAHIPLLPNNEERDRLYELTKRNIEYLSIINRFFKERDKEANLTMLDIFESSAFAFQKVSNRTIDLNLYKASVDSRYNKAWNYFTKCGGDDMVMFLLLSHLSLKFGYLPDDDFADVLPMPQSIFVHLCKSLSDFNSVMNDFYSETQPSFVKKIDIFGSSDDEIMLVSQKYDVNLTFLEYEFIEKLDATTEEINIICALLKIANIAINQIEQFFLVKKVKFTKNAKFTNNNHPMALGVIESLEESIPNISSNLFFISIITSRKRAAEFFNINLKKALKKEYVGFMDRSVDISDEEMLLDMINKVEDLISEKSVYCCSKCFKKHGLSTVRQIKGCDTVGSLNFNLQTITGKSIDEIFKG